MDRTYIAIDLKSFYASVECVDRGLDPLTTNLVVADASRTEKTICLAVSPSLKSYGIAGRARLFELVQQVREVNIKRKRMAPGRVLKPASSDNNIVSSDSSVELGYIVATPRMSRYMEMSNKIFDIYLKYVSAEDMHIYSVDEVFIDATPYLKSYGMDGAEFAMLLINDVLKETGITATAGVGTNMYLAKIAMDIEAKHMQADSNGVRLAYLDERKYREKLWEHEPITDFWRIGKGYARRLAELGLYTMGDVARYSLTGIENLYKVFGVNAELLIDHAWGYEPCLIRDIKKAKPKSHSLSVGQVLSTAYTFDKARLITREMTDGLVLDMVEKGVVCDQVVLTVCYDIENLNNREIMRKYKGPIVADFYGRLAPKAAHGSKTLDRQTSSNKIISDAMLELFDKLVNKDLLIRRVYVVANHVVLEAKVTKKDEPEQLDLFTDYDKVKEEKEKEEAMLAKEKKQQKTIIETQKKFGRNAINKAMNLEEGATAIKRHGMVGGHKG